MTRHPEAHRVLWTVGAFAGVVASGVLLFVLLSIAPAAFAMAILLAATVGLAVLYVTQWRRPSGGSGAPPAGS